MIKIIDTAQYATYKISHEINGDTLTVTVGNKTEEFDLTNLPEGKSERVEVEVLPLNPVVSIEKTGDIITVTLIRFYGDDEKEMFESGKNNMEI